MIPYVREMDFKYGRPDQVSPLITRVVADNPGPFTYVGTATFLVGGQRLAVIDPGPLLDTHLAALTSAIAGRPVSHIFTTHTHADHSPLAHPLKELTGATIVGRAAPEATSGEAPDEASFRPDIEIADGEVIEGDGWTLEAILTPGHASNHVAYRLKEENALFCGDHVMGWSTTVVSPPDGDMSDYYRSLDKVQARGFATLWPTHGPPIRDVAPFLAGYIEHRLKREAQIVRELGRGPRTIAEMTPRLYIGVDPRLHGAASRSMLAHLIHMARNGVVRADGEPSMDAIYSLPGQVEPFR
ncbi:MBL fold metallo-hydrolase [Caulobacter sp. S45]|uniref:MBL fold metallo-hydrolase n=1 Tax=Caulobacter sp. S45 TaxID=1641861 RepID=UPI0015774349|nr:MBL fold metallo-hydrolase [Caulobacter sp. S45]